MSFFIHTPDHRDVQCNLLIMSVYAYSFAFSQERSSWEGGHRCIIKFVGKDGAVVSLTC